MYQCYPICNCVGITFGYSKLGASEVKGGSFLLPQEQEEKRTSVRQKEAHNQRKRLGDRNLPAFHLYVLRAFLFQKCARSEENLLCIPVINLVLWKINLVPLLIVALFLGAQQLSFHNPRRRGELQQSRRGTFHHQFCCLHKPFVLDQGNLDYQLSSRTTA